MRKGLMPGQVSGNGWVCVLEWSGWDEDHRHMAAGRQMWSARVLSGTWADLVKERRAGGPGVRDGEGQPGTSYEGKAIRCYVVPVEELDPFVGVPTAE